MGQVEANTGLGRVYSSSGWVIEAWHGNGSTPVHTAFRFGAMNSTTIQGATDSYAQAYGGSQSSWESWMASNAPAGWTTWYGGLSGAVKAMLYEFCRASGEHGYNP